VSVKKKKSKNRNSKPAFFLLTESINTPEWTLISTITFSFNEKRTDVWTVALIIRIGPSQLLQHFLRSRTCPCRVQAGSIRLQLDEKKKKTPSIILPYQRDENIQPTEQETNLALHVLRIILSIHVARRRLVLQRQRRIPHLRRQPILQVQQTSLAHVLDLCARLAYHGRLKPHPIAWIPPEHRERSCACSAFSSEFLLGLKITDTDSQLHSGS
jgi:hypothetical protein